MTAGDEPSAASRDSTAGDLAREVYWARGGSLPSPAGPARISDRIDDFAHRMRIDHREPIPNDGSLLRSPSPLKRPVKSWIWRISRFSTKRYDRLLAELAELTGELAAQLESTEEEVARLREELARRHDEQP